MTADPSDGPAVRPVRDGEKPGKDRQPLHPVGMVGVLLLAAGLVGWVWTGDWRYAATGAIVFVALAAISGALTARRRSG